MKSSTLPLPFPAPCLPGPFPILLSLPPAEIPLQLPRFYWLWSSDFPASGWGGWDKLSRTTLPPPLSTLSPIPHLLWAIFLMERLSRGSWVVRVEGERGGSVGEDGSWETLSFLSVLWRKLRYLGWKWKGEREEPHLADAFVPQFNPGMTYIL